MASSGFIGRLGDVNGVGGEDLVNLPLFVEADDVVLVGRPVNDRLLVAQAKDGDEVVAGRTGRDFSGGDQGVAVA
jgi:hypothetical protein